MMMNKHKAREILKQYNARRRGDFDGAANYPSLMEIGQAIDTITQPNEIADNIRQAAINWPHHVGDFESGVIFAFCHLIDWPKFETDQGRIFMLFVAEAIES